MYQKNNVLTLFLQQMQDNTVFRHDAFNKCKKEFCEILLATDARQDHILTQCLLQQMQDITQELKPEALNHARRQIWWWSGVLCFVLVIAWPLLSLPAGVFSQVCAQSV